ncbi:Vesicle-associated membrane protein 713 [Mucuna pruriens]|uniref:Vesicle-associated membrane protein 713 n=1 Tax=Mucuna pruriens TaxID=157652 RepID=A0A371I0V5_MUCPR|nr:Vesicle-associated membrane protein 713 [Mucuna pruriens]
MGILYALVGRGSVVLAEFSGTTTNASAIARQILEKIPGNNDTHVSYSQDRYIFHVKRTDGLTVLCMADDTAGRRIPFAFLEDIHQKFVRTYGRAVHSAQPYGMNDEFSRVLSQQMEYYSSDPNADRINRLKGEMSQVRNVMIENIDKVLERGDRLELLVDKTANMQGNTFRFRKQARRFRSTVWWRNVKLTYDCTYSRPTRASLCCVGFCLPWACSAILFKVKDWQVNFTCASLSFSTCRDSHFFNLNCWVVHFCASEFLVIDSTLQLEGVMDVLLFKRGKDIYVIIISSNVSDNLIYGLVTLRVLIQIYENGFFKKFFSWVTLGPVLKDMVQWPSEDMEIFDIARA